MNDKLNANANSDATVTRGGGTAESAAIEGTYFVECRGPDGAVKWSDVIHNTVMTVGKNHVLDNYLEGSTYTTTGPFLGLISSVSYSAIAAADTMASHAGWTEAGSANAPQWTTPAAGARADCNAGFDNASAGAKALTSAKAFSISTSGTIKGAFMVIGSGAVATNANTGGTLLSAGLFTGGDKVVGNGDTLNVSYSLAL